MKIISWNVNGIRAAWGHGLSEFLDETDADIYAFQETKLSEPLGFISKTGYNDYWSFSTDKKGYSGTLCLTRYEPITVSYNMGDSGFDCEGRIITLEFNDLFFINAYFPNNSQGSNERFDYRCEWDERFIQYVSDLFAEKPVIICGDLNVAITNDDIFTESKWVDINSEGYLSMERENLNTIIDMGFVDTYRYVHPKEKGTYSWWSNRRHKRDDNRGWRIDYALVSLDIAVQTQESTMLTEIKGSDHCPIMLDIDISDPEFAYEQINAPKRKRLSDIPLTERNSLDTDSTRYNLEYLWQSVNWQEVEDNLAQMQTALAKSAYSRDKDLIQKWQKKIVYSLDAKLLAVRHVSSSSTSKGIDNVMWSTPQQKMSAVLSLTSKAYEALPSKMLEIETKGGKVRRIRLDTWRDRAMQTLYAYALDPVAESWAERKSFAFRKGRSTADLNEYIKLAFAGENAPEWAFVGDVKQCYENISHEWILKHIPVYKPILLSFLKAGYILSGELFPTDMGIGIGCTLSPIIANMVLDDMQEYIYMRMYGERYDIDYDNGNLLRYADDVIVSARTEEQAKEIAGYIREFLEERGLDLSDKKSRIVNVRQGFTFLSRFYIKKDDAVCVYPSDEAVKRFKNTLKETITDHSGSQQRLIEKINRKIDGWTTYHKIEQSDREFREIDVFLKAFLLQSCETKHPRWDRQKILEKYWYMQPNGQYCYALPDKKEVHIKSLSDTVIIKHNVIKTKENPYIDIEYFEEREHRREINNVSGIYRAIWNRQSGCCQYCGEPILRDQEKDVIETSPHGRKINRLSYVHSRCKSFPLVHCKTDTMPDSVTDISELLGELQTRTKGSLKDRRYLGLEEYFLKCTAPLFSLTFEEIEKIIGRSLGRSQEYHPFWYETGFGKISTCWLENGYVIKNLHIDKHYVVFQQVHKNISNLEIPSVFLTKKIPTEAKYELENYFQYIKKKYGL